MPIVKQISVHASPKAMLSYILNGDKNSEMKYADAINSVVNVDRAYKLFEENFERYSDEKFFKYTIEPNGKEKVRLHHYIQSFDPKEENITPEEAHKIGMEWARKAFGSDRQIICSTHIDKKHIHNHFAVAAYSDSGVKWNSNCATLMKCRKISDEISLQHGISIIENPSKHGGVKYKEWIENRQKGSWKTDLRNILDKMIADEKIKNLQQLFDELRKKGYTVRHGKYITIRPPKIDKGVRTYRLGHGYSEQDLIYRIQNKDKEYSVSAIMQQYKGIQVEYALCIRQIQLIVYHKLPNSKRYSVRNVQEMSNVLTYMSEYNLFSKNDFEKNLISTQTELDKKKEELGQAKKDLAAQKKIQSDCTVYTALLEKIPDVSEDERKEFLRTQYCGKYSIDLVNEKVKQLEIKVAQLTAEENILWSNKNNSEKMLEQYERNMKDDYTIMLEQIRLEKEEAMRMNNEQQQVYEESYEDDKKKEENSFYRI